MNGAALRRPPSGAPGGAPGGADVADAAAFAGAADAADAADVDDAALVAEAAAVAGPATASRRRDLLVAAALAATMGAGSWAGWAWTPRRLLADSLGRRPLAELVPAAFGAWRPASNVRLVAPAPDVQQALERVYDDSLARAWRAADGRLVMLSLSYGRRQRGEGILHRPEVCYAGQGFAVQRWPADDGSLQAGGRRLEVTRLVTQGPRPEPVTYWLVVGSQVVRFGLGWRWATLLHGLRGEVADGMLVRVSSLDADAERAFALQQRFVQDLAAALAAAAAERLLGALP